MLLLLDSFNFKPREQTKSVSKTLTRCEFVPTDRLNDALGAIRVLGLELIEHELTPHLNTVLLNIKERSE